MGLHPLQAASGMVLGSLYLLSKTQLRFLNAAIMRVTLDLAVLKTIKA